MPVGKWLVGTAAMAGLDSLGASLITSGNNIKIRSNPLPTNYSGPALKYLPRANEEVQQAGPRGDESFISGGGRPRTVAALRHVPRNLESKRRDRRPKHSLIDGRDALQSHGIDQVDIVRGNGPAPDTKVTDRRIPPDAHIGAIRVIPGGVLEDVHRQSGSQIAVRIQPSIIGQHAVEVDDAVDLAGEHDSVVMPLAVVQLRVRVARRVAAGTSDVRVVPLEPAG